MNKRRKTTNKRPLETGLLLTAILGGMGLILGSPGQAQSTANTPKPLPYTGVNISGGEFYDPSKIANPIYGKNFTYPTEADFTYFAGKGMNVFRVPFLWETLQPTLMEPLRQDEVDRLKGVVSTATSRGLVVLLDPHDYARYKGSVIGGAEVTDADFADFWGRLAEAFGHDKQVWFGLMNEPHDMPTTQWLDAANAAIAAIRKTGARNFVLVPGNAWTGAGSWLDSGDGGANGTVMLGVHDPDNHFAFEVHQYLDSDSSGTHAAVVSPTIGEEKLRAFTDWCRVHHKRAFLGEFGTGDTPQGQPAIDTMLRFMEQNRDVWLGFTWWSAGAWWGDYMFTLEPKNGQDRPQMAWLLPHLHGATTPK